MRVELILFWRSYLFGLLPSLNQMSKDKYPCRECGGVYSRLNLILKKPNSYYLYCPRCWNKLFYHKIYVKKEVENKEIKNEQTT